MYRFYTEVVVVIELKTIASKNNKKIFNLVKV